MVQRKKPVIQEQVQHVPKAGGDLGLLEKPLREERSHLNHEGRNKREGSDAANMCGGATSHHSFCRAIASR